MSQCPRCGKAHKDCLCRMYHTVSAAFMDEFAALAATDDERRQGEVSYGEQLEKRFAEIERRLAELGALIAAPNNG